MFFFQLIPYTMFNYYKKCFISDLRGSYPITSDNTYEGQSSVGLRDSHYNNPALVKEEPETGTKLPEQVQENTLSIKVEVHEHCNDTPKIENNEITNSVDDTEKIVHCECSVEISKDNHKSVKFFTGSETNSLTKEQDDDKTTDDESNDSEKDIILEQSKTKISTVKNGCDEPVDGIGKRDQLADDAVGLKHTPNTDVVDKKSPNQGCRNPCMSQLDDDWSCD